MIDPFESLRHDAERTGSTAIDPRFRADVLAEARRRLTSEAPADSIRPRVPADTPTPIPMEPIPMLAKNPKKTRPLLLAAACVALVAAAVAATVALRGDDAQPAPADTAPPTSIRSTVPLPPSTTDAPAPTVPASTAAPSTAPAPTLPAADVAAASAMLLPNNEYAPGWNKSAMTNWGVGFDPTVAEQIPACSPYISSVFDVIAASAHATRIWYRFSPYGFVPQYAAVLPDSATAQSIFDVLNSAEFGPCANAYDASQSQTPATRESLAPGFPLPMDFDLPTIDLAGESLGDALVVRRGRVTFATQADDIFVQAAVRVDRSIMFVTALNSQNAVEEISELEFHDMLTRAVDRAATTLNVSVPASSVTASTLPPLTDAEVAHAMMLTEQEYGDWDVMPAGAGLDAAMDAEIAGGLDACAPFLETVFDRVDPESTSVQLFHHVNPQALFSQYVAVFPDTATAREVYEIVNTAQFVPCAIAYGTAVTPGASNQPGHANRPLPSPLDKPISDPPFPPIGDAMAYRRFIENYNGPQTDLDAVMLVDRTITFIGTVTDGEGGATLNTVDQFESALQRIAERANAALAGDANP